MKEWYTYIVKCSDGSLYTGITVDVERRVNEHNTSTKGAKYTSTKRPVHLVYSETQENRSSASKRESAIKKLSRAGKLKIINEKGTETWKQQNMIQSNKMSKTNIGNKKKTSTHYELD